VRKKSYYPLYENFYRHVFTKYRTTSQLVLRAWDYVRVSVRKMSTTSIKPQATPVAFLQPIRFCLSLTLLVDFRSLEMEFSQYNVNALMYITPRPEIVFTEGSGMWLTDNNGKRYLDYLQGWAVNCLGHSLHPRRTGRAVEKTAESISCVLQRADDRTGFASDRAILF
jgi:hypothetical protein